MELEPKTRVVAGFELQLRHLSKKAVTRIVFKNTVAFTLVLLYKKHQNTVAFTQVLLYKKHLNTVAFTQVLLYKNTRIR